MKGWTDMKIRRGFVSNSSSSCFIVAFPKKIETLTDVMDAIFRGVPFVVRDSCGNHVVDSTIAASEVYQSVSIKQHVFWWEEGAEQSTEEDWDMPLTEDQISKIAKDYDLPGDPNYWEESKVHESKMKSMGLDRFGNRETMSEEDLEKSRKMEQEFYDDLNRRTGENHKKVIAKFFADNPGTFVYHFEWDDKSPIGFAMETGDVFRKLPHIKINRH